MGDWLRWAPEYLAREGLTVHVLPGFETRTRRDSPDGLDSILWLAVHHTVSNFSNPADEADFLANRHPVAPVGNLFLDRRGDWWCIAAGATNTNGSGGPMHVSQGFIPESNGNRTAPAVEAANNGVGERWPDVQIDSYVAGSAALIKGVRAETRWRPEAGDVRAHSEWAPDRKVDPGGPCRFAPNGGEWADVLHLPLRVTGMDLFRGEIFAALLPPTPQPPEEDVMQLWIGSTSRGVFVTDGVSQHRKLRDEAGPHRFIQLCKRDGVKLVDIGTGRLVETRRAVTEIDDELARAAGINIR